MNTQKSVNGERVMAVIIDTIIFSAALSGIMYIYRALFIEGETFTDFVDIFTNPLMQEVNEPNVVAVNIIISFIIGLILFVFIPSKKNGKTLGKMLFGIKAIDENGDNPSLKQHFVRAIDIYNTYIYVALIWLIFVDMDAFIIAETVMVVIIGFVTIITAIMIFSRPDNRGIHDLIAKTHVVHKDFDPSQTEDDTFQANWAQAEKHDDIFDKTQDILDEPEDNDPWNQ